MIAWKWSIGVTSAERRVSTIAQTIDSLLAAGFGGPAVLKPTVSFDGSAIPAYWWSYNLRFVVGVRSGVRGGPYPNFKYTLREILDSIGDVDAILICQDDIEVSRGLCHYLNASERFCDFVTSGDVVSLYTAAPNHSEAGGWHFAARPNRQSFGALCYAMHPTTARAFLAADINPDRARGPDTAIGKFCAISDRRLWMHSPSFVRHIGAVSSLPDPNLNHWARQCKEFCDDATQIDARSD